MVVCMRPISPAIASKPPVEKRTILEPLYQGTGRVLCVVRVISAGERRTYFEEPSIGAECKGKLNARGKQGEAQDTYIC